MAQKSEADLALAEKLDLARTLVRYKTRREAARELNELESQIATRHNAEVAEGTWTQVDLSSIGAAFLAKGLPSGEDAPDAPAA